MSGKEFGGDVAIELVREIAEPTAMLRDRLGLVVDHLERHVAHASGPEPYPWRALTSLRQDLGALYLDANTLARRVDELSRALADLNDDARRRFDLAAATDLGLRLAASHLGAGLELLIDLGGTPAVVGSPGLLALVVAQLVAASAASARALDGSTLTVRVAAEENQPVLLIADNGGGSNQASALGELASSLLTPWGVLVEATSAPGQGTAFELRFPVA